MRAGQHVLRQRAWRWGRWLGRGIVWCAAAAPDPDGPGPFRFGDPDQTTAMLQAAGFTDVTMTLHQADQPLGGSGASGGGGSQGLIASW